MDLDLILWLLALLFPELRPLRKGGTARRKRRQASVAQGSRRARERRSGAGISWCFAFDRRERKNGREPAAGPAPSAGERGA